jgi:hypothetical protein
MSARRALAAWGIAILLFPMVAVGVALSQAEWSPPLSFVDEDNDDDGDGADLAIGKIWPTPIPPLVVLETE